MSQLFKNLLEIRIDKKETKEEINKLKESDIQELINDIFWRYDSEKAELKIHVEKNLINEQRLIYLVSDFPYYVNTLLEEIKFYKQRELYIKDLSLVKYLKVNDKEIFLKILKKLTCIKFFINNYDNFNYNLEEKQEIQNILNNYSIRNSTKKIFNINTETQIKIFNKTGLIVPFLLLTNIYRGDSKEEFNFFIEYFKYCPDHEIIKRIFLGYNNYEIKNFKQEYYQEFLLNNIEYTKLLTKQFQIDFENYNKVGVNSKILNGLKFIKQLTEQILLKYQIENF